MPLTQLTYDVVLTGTTNYYLNHPANSGMNDGYWYYYSASAANSTLGAKIKPYRWGTPLDTNETNDFLTMDGTINLVSESLNRTRVFHGSGIIRDGAGLNSQLGLTMDDAFYFYHLGDLRANDNIGYWDYAYLQNGASEWTYFQYHQHNPNIYPNLNNGRGIHYANQWINEVDKSFGHLQQTEVTVMTTTYLNVMARVHTPSAGFAHNSHYDVELPATKNKNYLMGGVIKGTSERLHAFYIAANGSDWDVFSRTYIPASEAWSAEVNHGTYNLADPTFIITNITGSIHNYPFSASCGAISGSDVYTPVIYNNPTSGFDLKTWTFTSDNAILTNTISTQSIVTGVANRPDCHLTLVNGELYALVSDVTNGGVDFYKKTGSTWNFVDSVVTNGNQDIIRIHGFDYNTTDTKFYALLSGDITGSGGTYSGSGVYSWSEGIAFSGYKHLSYFTSSYGFVNRNPLGGGYISYTNSDGSLVFKSGSEPAGIAETERILVYDEASPKFFDKTDTKIGGSEYYYAGCITEDGRLVGVGVVEDNLTNLGTGPDLVTAIYDTTGERPIFIGSGGDKDDYFTGVIEDRDNRNLWMVGYTKSYLAQKRDIKVHGFGRGFIDGNNKLEWRDVKIDSEGNQYFVGNHLENSGSIVARYDYNFNNQWLAQLSSTGHTEGYSLCLDSEKNVYVVGRTNDGGAGGYDAFIAKLNQSGSLQWSKYFGAIGDQYASSVETITKSSTEYIVSTIISGTTTIVNVLNTSGSIVEQRVLSGFTTNRIRKSDSETSDFFLLAGKDNSSPSKAAFAKGQILASGDMFKWIRTYSSGSLASEAFDIRNTEQSTGNGGLGSLTGPAYHVVGSESTNGFILKFFMDESAGSFQSTKSWGRNISGSVLTSLTNTSYTTTPSGNRYTYGAGYSSVSPEGQGGEEGLYVSFDYTGSRIWTTTLGHTGNERILSLENDITGENLISAGWSESHSNGRRTFNFRSVNTGYGTGNYHEVSSPGMEMWYFSSSLSVSTNNGTLSTVTPPSNTSPSFTSTSGSLTISASPYTEEYYDGGNLFDFFVCKLSLDDVAIFKNSEQYKSTVENCQSTVLYNNDIFTYYQIGSAGDGTADDGNFFGYDIVKLSGSNILAMVGQTSADITKYNAGSSGVYDYTLVEFDIVSGSFIEIYQNGTSFDEEIYALTELNDGSGSVAFVGRTTGNIGGSMPLGTYDILLGIYNGVTEQFNYYTTGSSNIDKAVNLHDIGNNEIALVFESADVITNNNTNFGGLDVGVIKFNYSSSLWSTSSYQIGSTEDEILGQEGKHSVYLPNSKRIAVCGKTLGTFADNSISFGVNDMFLALFDTTTNTWTKYQIGTQANETGTVVFNIGGDRLIVGGYTDASFEEPNNGIFVGFDASLGVRGKSSI